MTRWKLILSIKFSPSINHFIFGNSFNLASILQHYIHYPRTKLSIKPPESLQNNMQSNLQAQWLFANIAVEIKSNDNFKFTPSRFWQLKGRCFHNPCWIIKTRMQLKNSTLYHRTQIFIGCSTNIDSPLMRLVPIQITRKCKQALWFSCNN